MSAAIKGATSCYSVEADSYSVHKPPWTSAPMQMSTCVHLKPHGHVCDYVCTSCKMIPGVNGKFLMCTSSPGRAISRRVSALLMHI